MCLPVLSLGVLSWHKPSQWQLQVLESWWKIRESKEVISSEVVWDLLVMLDSCCPAQPFYLMNQLIPFQHEENVVGIMWLSETPVGESQFCIWLHLSHHWPGDVSVFLWWLCWNQRGNGEGWRDHARLTFGLIKDSSTPEMTARSIFKLRRWDECWRMISRTKKG